MRLYDNSRTVHNEADILADFQSRSALVYDQYPHKIEIYGTHERHKMDMFSCEKFGAPLLIFIHGGYWQWCDKEDFAFIVPPVLAQGLDVVLLEYPLTPNVSFEELVHSVQWGLDHLFSLAENQNRHVILCGHSAGGHLSAQFQNHPLINEVHAISGLFDLQPLQATHLNEALNLSANDIQTYSPVRHLVGNKPLHIIYGGQELAELQWQSTHYAQALKEHHSQVTLQCLEHCNHYNILDAVFNNTIWMA